MSLYLGQQNNSQADKNFKPREYAIGGETFTASTPGEAAALDKRRQAYIDEKVRKSGEPVRPEWDSMLGKDGLVSDQYQLGQYVDSAMADDEGFNKFKSEALRDGPSEYTNRMLEAQGLERQDQIGDINSQYQMGLQNATDQMASQGGLYAGAGERIGANSIKSLLQARQGSRQDFNKNKLGLMADDERNRVAGVQSLSGMEMDRNRMQLTGRESDIKNSLVERDSKRSADLDKWNTEMETWASNKQADAQARSGGGCFPRGTMIKMKDLSFKKIEDVKIGDECFFGGKVTKTIQGDATGMTWFDYQGVIVTGSHLVLDGGTWKPVEGTDEAMELEVKFEVLYNLSNQFHEISINGEVFSDYDDVDDATLSYSEALREKNRELNV